MELPIYVYGTEVLREKTREVTEEEFSSLGKLIENMFETMYASDGVGLAAPQVGKAIRLFVVDADPLGDDFPDSKGFKKVFINPTITEYSEESCTMQEGCLSLPGLNENVDRPKQITIKYLDEQMVPHEESYSGFNARVIQHEYDHLEQTPFTDRVNPMRKAMIKRKLQKMSRGQVRAHYKVITK